MGATIAFLYNCPLSMLDSHYLNIVWSPIGVFMINSNYPTLLLNAAYDTSGHPNRLVPKTNPSFVHEEYS